MPVTEFECAIAKSQIGRYIKGEKLGQDVVNQLESHIAACPRCKSLLEEKRNSLLSVIEADKEAKIIMPTASMTPMHAAPSTPSPSPETFGALARKYSEPVEGDPKLELRKQLLSMANKRTGTIEVPVVAPAFAHRSQKETVTLTLEDGHSPELKKKPSSAFALFKRVDENEVDNAPANSGNDPTMRKPIAYMTGLTMVIIAMAVLSKNPTSLFGPKAGDARTVTAKISAPKKSVAAQKFAAIRKQKVVTKPVIVPKPKLKTAPNVPQKLAAKPIAKRTPVKKTLVPTSGKSVKSRTSIKTSRPKAQRFVSETTSKRPIVSTKKRSPKRSVKPSTISPKPANGTVKIYAPGA